MAELTDYKGNNNFLKAYLDPKEVFSKNTLFAAARQVAEENLIKGLIDEDTFDKAMEQLEGLEKGGKGEGSRGGKIIGHTRSGKAIYEDANHGSHKDFTSSDHQDAANLHGLHSTHHMKYMDSEGDHKKSNNHFDQRSEHWKHTSTKDDTHESYEHAHRQFKTHMSNEHVEHAHSAQNRASGTDDKNIKMKHLQEAAQHYHDASRHAADIGDHATSHRHNQNASMLHGHIKNLKDQGGIPEGSKVKLKHSGAEGTVHHQTKEGHYVKLKDGSDGYFHRKDIE